MHTIDTNPLLLTREKPSDRLRGRHFDRAPFLVIWEITRACDLACRHCRASAQPERNPLELSTEEGFALEEEVRRFGRPLFVLTGGDPLKRGDVFDLIAHAHRIGLRVSLSPSGTPLLTTQALARAKEAGAEAVSISIDGATSQSHDSFRGVNGSFRWCVEGAKAAARVGLTLQINTTVTRFNVGELEDLAQLVEALGARRWSLFFLVPTGRGDLRDEISASEYESVLNWLYDLSGRVSFRVKTTEAQHYRRVSLQRLSRDTGVPVDVLLKESSSGKGRFLPGINSGKGFVFVSHTGDIYPSGFLPLRVGNVRSDSLVEVYRNHPLMKALREPGNLKGRCGKCEFRAVCGGSRARAYAVHGDPFAEDPFCNYIPRGDAHE